MTGATALLPIQPQSPGLAERIWWGAGTRETAAWAAEQGMNLMSSTLLHRGHRRPVRRAPGRADRALPRGVAAGRLGARAARLGQPQRDADHDRPRPRATSAATRRREDQVGYLDGGARPLRPQLHRRARRDRRGARAATPPSRAADTLLLTVPNQLGVEYNARLLETIARAHRAGDRLDAGSTRWIDSGRLRLEVGK